MDEDGEKSGLNNLDQEAMAASAAFDELQQKVKDLTAALSQIGQGVDGIKAIKNIASELSSQLMGLRDSTGNYTKAASESAQSSEALQAALVALAQSAGNSGMDNLSENAKTAANALAESDAATKKQSSSIMDMIISLIQYISIAGTVYEVIGYVNKFIDIQALLWGKLKGVIAAAGAQVSITSIAFTVLKTVLSALPPILSLCIKGLIRLAVAAAPVLAPLLAIAFAIGTIVAAWKVFWGTIGAGSALLKLLTNVLWEVSKAGYEVGKVLGKILVEGFKRVNAAGKSLVSSMQSLAASIKTAILGSLDRMADALYKVIPALDKLSDIAANASTKTSEFFQRMYDDARVAGNTVFRLTQTFGASSAEITKWAQAYSDGVGRAFTTTAQQLLTFNNEFKKLALSSTLAAELSKTVVRLGNDIGSSLGADPVKVFSALKAAIGGNLDELYELGVVVEQAAIKQELLNKSINPASANKAQIALATLSAAAQSAAGSWNHLQNNTEKYGNQQQTLNAEILKTSELLGGVLTISHSKFHRAMIGGLRVLQQWIQRSGEFIQKFVDLPEILLGASVAFKAMAIGASLTAGALLAVSSILSVILSPLGLISRELIRQSELLQTLTDLYNNAFGGAIRRMVETAMAAKIAGVSIGNWFSIGFLTAKKVAFDAIGAILKRLTGFISSIPGLIRSVGAFDLFGSSVGKKLELTFLNIKKVLLQVGLAGGTVFDILRSGFIKVYSLVENVIAALKRGKDVMLTFAALQTGQFGAALAYGKSAWDNKDYEEAQERIDKLKDALGGDIDTDKIRKSISDISDEIKRVQEQGASGQSKLVESIASAAEVASQAAAGLMDQAGNGLQEKIGEIREQIKALKDPANNIGGMELDKEMSSLIEQINSGGKNAPMLDEFKNWFSDLLPQIEETVRPSAQGTFSGQLQGETTNIARDSLRVQQRIEENTRRQLDSGAVIAVAGR